MKTLINQMRFLKALEYTSAHYFSKPYGISPIVDRWFNQLAMIELEGKSRPLQLSLVNQNGIANFPVDIVVDGEVLPKDKVALIFKFHSQKSKYEDERKELKEKNFELEERRTELENKKEKLEDILRNNPSDEAAQADLKDHEESFAIYQQDRAATQTLESFDHDKEEAKAIYSAIVLKINEDKEALLKDPTHQPRVKSVINIAAIEAQYKAKVTNIVHRPNHGFAHSARAAYSVTAIQSYRNNHSIGLDLNLNDLEKLQVMMLFSVVGRQDETGFADTGPGNAVYKSFRSASGRAYLNYCLSKEGEDLYRGDVEQAYRDALVVELMGYSRVENAMKLHPTPELLIDYAVMKEAAEGKTVTREEALTKITKGEYSLEKLFHPAIAHANEMITMMNDAHALDLTRCYPLFPTSPYGPKSISVLDYHLSQSGFTAFSESPNLDQLESFYQFMRTSFDTLRLTGQNSMFGLLSKEEFEAQKESIMKEVKAIHDYCNNPENRDLLIQKALNDHRADNQVSYFTSSSLNETDLLKIYRNYLIRRAVSEKLGGVVEYNLNQSQLLQFNEAPTPEKLDEFHRLLSLSYNTIPGKTILTLSEYTAQKEAILKEMKRIIADYKNPARLESLLTEAKQSLVDPNNPFRSDASNDKELIKDYQRFQIANAAYKGLTGNTLTESLKNRLASDNCMFKFQHKQEGSLSKFDHHKNALEMLQGLQSVSPYKELLPKISAVKHLHDQGKTRVSFEDQANAIHFQKAYTTQFGTKPQIVEHDGAFSIEVDKTHYNQMRSEQLIEFKQVSVPKKVEREDHLIDAEGKIAALSLIGHNQGLVRLVSTTALNGESFPDYDYLLKALEDPVHERYTPALKEMDYFPVKQARYADPRSGTTYERTVVDNPASALRFQEPITEPPSFADKQVEGWTVNKGARGASKNTIYTKKMAHTLMPAHGKMLPFAGYTQTQHLYFPIGVLSDVRQVNLKDERYIWAQNMVTASKFWIRDPFNFRKGIHVLLNADLQSGVLRRHSNGVAKLNLNKTAQFSNPALLIKHLEDKAAKFSAKLGEKYYRPSDEDLNDFKKLLAQQKQVYLKQVKDDPEAKQYTKQIQAIFSTMNKRIDLEATRKDLKYSMTRRELIEHQKTSSSAEAHNELLAANTKGAMRAFYATKDTLFDRLNVAFHAMKIKEKYGYDVPLLVMSHDKAPYNYTESMIKEDLKEAAKLLRAGTFPFDRTLFKVYEFDAMGRPVVVAGEKVVMKDAQGREITVPKNLQAQQDLLFDFFKVGLPELSQFDQLTGKPEGSKPISESEIDAGIERLMKKMDFIGGLTRETERMKRTFAQGNPKAKEQFFLRACSLGHTSLVKQIMPEVLSSIQAGKAYKAGIAFLKKAAQLVSALDKHSPEVYEIQHYLTSSKKILELAEKIAHFEGQVANHGKYSDEETLKRHVKDSVKFLQKLESIPDNTITPELKSELIDKVKRIADGLNREGVSLNNTVIALLHQEKISPVWVVKLFPDNKDIVLAAVQKEPSCLAHAADEVINALEKIASQNYGFQEIAAKTDHLAHETQHLPSMQSIVYAKLIKIRENFQQLHQPDELAIRALCKSICATKNQIGWSTYSKETDGAKYVMDQIKKDPKLAEAFGINPYLPEREKTDDIREMMRHAYKDESIAPEKKQNIIGVINFKLVKMQNDFQRTGELDEKMIRELCKLVCATNKTPWSRFSKETDGAKHLIDKIKTSAKVAQAFGIDHAKTDQEKTTSIRVLMRHAYKDEPLYHQQESRPSLKL